MTKQFTDKLDDAINELFAAYSNTGFWRSDKARQQILAAIDEAAPTPNPKEWAGNLPQMAWTIGYEKGIADFLKALGIEKGKSPTAQIFITNDLPTLLEKGEE